MKPVICAYVPPPKLPYAEPFLRNIRKHKTKNDLLLFSEHDWPDVKRLQGTPEILKNEKDRHNRDKAWTMANLIFYTGIDMAVRAGYTHAIYVEADSRVKGDGWDARIFDEFFGLPMPAIIGGSMVIHNPATSGIVGLRRWDDTVRRNKRRNFPIPTFGDCGGCEKKDSCVFVYGSGMVIDLAWWSKLFAQEERDHDVQSIPQVHQFGMTSRLPRSPAIPPENGFWPVKLARNSRPFDVELGVRIWNLFGPDAYDVIANLTTIFSSYGDLLTSEDQRLSMLSDGANLVHQVKSAVEV